MLTPLRTQYLGLALMLCWAAPSASAQATRDSAGIRLIDNVKPVWRPGHEWRLSERPIVVIGEGQARPISCDESSGPRSCRTDVWSSLTSRRSSSRSTMRPAVSSGQSASKGTTPSSSMTFTPSPGWRAILSLSRRATSR